MIFRTIVKSSLLVLSISYTSVGFSSQEARPEYHQSKSEKKSFIQFDSLVEMQKWAVDKYAARPLFGTKVSGSYQWMSYKTFGKEVDRIRGGLSGLGLRSGDKAAIISDNSPEWAVTCYASMGLGAAFVPMYTSQTLEEWEFKVRNSDAKILFVANQDLYQKVKHFPGIIDSLEHVIDLSRNSPNQLSYKSLLKDGKHHPAPTVSTDPDQLMGLIYTSGTTGTPKGVMLTHKNVSSLLTTIPEIIEIEGERSLSFLPWAHIFGQIAELHSLLYLGNSTGFAESTRTIVSDMKELHPTIFFSVPTVFNRIYDKTHNDALEAGGLKKALFKNWKKVRQRQRQGDKPGKVKTWLAKITEPKITGKIKDALGGQLKYAMSGGAKLDPTVGEFIDDLGVVVLEGYGMSESSGIISMNTLKHNRIGSVGKPLPGVSIQFENQDLDGDGGGEIIVCGANIMQGYYKLPEKSSEDLTADGCLRTGDIGKFDDDGFLYITGRAKEIYKLENGKYVVPTTFENRLKLSKYFKDAFLYGENRPYNILLALPDPEQINLLKEKEHKTDSEINEILEAELTHIKKEFSGYTAPKKHLILNGEDWTQENGLLTPTMKIKRSSIFHQYKSRINSLYP